jgi:hypothetical protein
MTLPVVEPRRSVATGPLEATAQASHDCALVEYLRVTLLFTLIVHVFDHC